MQINLGGRSALVTGGATGIGRAIALALAGAGADVALTYHRHHGDNVASQIADLERKTAAFPLDANNSAEVDDAVDQAGEALDGLDILINNTDGLIDRQNVAEMSDEHWYHVIDVNLSSEVPPSPSRRT